MEKSTVTENVSAETAALTWQECPQPSLVEAETLEKETGLLPLMVRLLLRRGLKKADDVRAFLEPSLEDLLDPFLMFGMGEASERLAHAVEQQELIVVVGDYDVDGMSSCALLVDFLRVCEAQVQYFIPSRFAHGHGLSKRAVAALIKMQPRLLVTVDHGISFAEEITHLQAQGIDTIVTDHHLPPQDIPPGIVVNPHLPQCAYPFKQLSGCGVVFKLVCSLRSTLHRHGYWDTKRTLPRLKEYLDLVALGTVADVMAVNGENRILVYHGLRQLAANKKRAGMEALLSLAGITLKDGVLGSRDISFALAPRLNAAGRMHDPQLAVQLLLAQNLQEAVVAAHQLDDMNKERRKVEQQNFQAALEKIETKGLDKHPALVVSDEQFHQGVLGIVASRLCKLFKKPTLVFTLNADGNYKASGRAPSNYHIQEALAKGGHLCLNFGGHAPAGGCLVAPEHLEAFTQIFMQACQEQAASYQVPLRSFEERLDCKQLSFTLAKQIESLGPFGPMNENPCFALEQNAINCTPHAFHDRHLKWQLGDGAEMIAWNQSNQWQQDIPWCYFVQISTNVFRGSRKVLLTVNEMHQGKLPSAS